MRRGWRCAALLAFAAVAAPAGGQDEGSSGKPGPLPVWAKSLEAALATAKERNVAVMVALNIDNERGNDGMVRSVYRSKAFATAAKECVVAIGSLYDHREAKHPVTGDSVCSRFGTISCADHKAFEKIIRVDWLEAEGQMIESPRHFFLAPNGRMLFQRTWTLSSIQLAGLMKRATALCTPERLAAWDTLEGRLQRVSDPFQTLREIALKDLLDEKDPAIDKLLADAARKAKDDDARGDIVAAFAAAEDPARRAIAYGFLADKDPKMRLQVAYTLERRRDPLALDALLGRVGKEKDGKARAGMLRTIGACGKGEKKARDVLLKSARKKKDEAAPHAVVALAGWADDAAVFKALVKLPWSEATPMKVRQAAAWWLGLTGKKDELREKLRALGKEERSLERACGNAVKRLAGRYDEKRYMWAVEEDVRHPASRW